MIHCGLLLIVAGAILSWQTVRSERMFLHADGDVLPLFGHEIAYVSDSVISVDGSELPLVAFHPQQAGGWRFQLLMSSDGVTAVEMRRDPVGAPLVFAGYALFALGGLIRSWSRIELLAVAFIVGRIILWVFPDRLMTPALQSGLFELHVGFIAVAYLLFLGLPWLRPQRARRLLGPAVWLFGLGIALGSMWGYDAWGRYWGWDPKETGALVVWLAYCLPIHFRAIGSRRAAYILPLLLLPLLLILPGLHSYL